MNGSRAARVDPVYETFNLLRPPPGEPPLNAAEPELWELQLRWWWNHTPPTLRSPRCRTCHRHWPCPAWFGWNRLLWNNHQGRTAADIAADATADTSADTWADAPADATGRTGVTGTPPTGTTATAPKAGDR